MVNLSRLDERVSGKGLSERGSLELHWCHRVETSAAATKVERETRFGEDSGRRSSPRINEGCRLKHTLSTMDRCM